MKGSSYWSCKIKHEDSANLMNLMNNNNAKTHPKIFGTQGNRNSPRRANRRFSSLISSTFGGVENLQRQSVVSHTYIISQFHIHPKKISLVATQILFLKIRILIPTVSIQAWIRIHCITFLSKWPSLHPIPRSSDRTQVGRVSIFQRVFVRSLKQSNTSFLLQSIG